MKTLAPALVVARIPRVNLMPGAEAERLARESIARRWLVALSVTIAVMAFACAGAAVLAWDAGHRLATEQARTSVLITELETLSEVSGAMQLRTDLDRFRSEILRADYLHNLDIGAVAVAVGE